MPGVSPDPTKRCPRCGALAPLTAPLCLTCGREFRGTIGQGAAGPSASVPDPASAPESPAPPPRLGADYGVPPISTPLSIDAPDPRLEEDRAAGTRISLILVAVFVVGTVLLAIVAKASSRRDATGSSPPPRSASSATAPKVEAVPRVEVATATLSLYRNVENRTQYEATVTLRNSGTIAARNVEVELRAFDAAGVLTYAAQDVRVLPDGAELAPGASYTPPMGQGHLFFADRAGRPIRIEAVVSSSPQR